MPCTALTQKIWHSAKIYHSFERETNTIKGDPKNGGGVKAKSELKRREKCDLNMD